DGQEQEYRDLAEAFTVWNNANYLLLNTSKTKLVRKAGNVFSTHSLETLKKVVERATGAQEQAINNNLKHPLSNILKVQESNAGSGRLITLRCKTERFRWSFVSVYHKPRKTHFLALFPTNNASF
ncbi:hypothetical protein FSCOSCO3_A026425, partial [Scomber scombrus]